MRKVIKILAKVLSVIVLLLIFLPISVTLLLNLESVQNYVVGHATEYASDMLGTRVSIKRIDMDLFSRVRVEGFYVEDMERDTLIYVDRARASIATLNIKRDGLCLHDVEASDAKFYLREMESGELNIKPIVAKLQNPDGKGNFRMYISDLKVDNLDFHYTRLVPRNPVYGVDYGDMRICGVDAMVENFSVVEGAVRGNIISLSATERSGFEVEHLSGEMLVDRGVIHVDNLEVITPNSELYMPRMHINGENWQQYKNYIEEVKMDMVAEKSVISSDDVAYFAPALRPWGIKLSDADITFNGTVADFEATVQDVAIGNDSRLDATAHITGMPNWRDAKYVVGVENMHITSRDAETILDAVMKQPLPENVQQIIDRVEWIEMRATFGGRWDSFRMAGNVYTPKGHIRTDVDVANAKSGRYRLNGIVDVDGVELGEILNQPNLGALSATVNTAGTIGDEASGGIIGDINLVVKEFEYGAYTYCDVHGVGAIDGRKFYGEVSSTDPNLDFSMFADVDLNAASPYYNISMMLNNADLYALGINKRDTISTLSANVGVELSGASLEELNGYVSIADAEYHYTNGDIYSNRMRIDLESTPEQKSVACTSDFFNFEFQSNSSYRDTYNYLYNSLKTYVPLLYENASEVKISDAAANSPNNYTVLTLTANDEINSFLDAVIGGFVIAPETSVSLTFNPRSNNIILRGKSEALEYSGLIMADVEFDVNNSSRDSMSMRIKSGGVYRGTTLLMPNFNLTGGARENRISITAGFKDKESNRSAMLGVAAKFGRDTQTNHRSIRINITPSHFTVDTLQWKLYARGIDIDSSRINVKDLRITHGNEQLRIDGVASRLRTDSLQLTLNDFDISPLTQLVSRWGYRIEGASTGYATVKSALNNPEIEARISIDEFEVNDLPAPPQDIITDWDFQENRARVFVCDRQTKDTLIMGYYQPNGNRYYANARIRRLKAELIQPFLRGIVSDIEGDVNVYATIEGAGRMAQLNGRATVEDIATTVDFTKVRYSAPYGELRVENNHIYADGISLYDQQGNKGVFKMDLNLNHLSNVEYDISVEAEDILVLDTKSKDNDLFYGHVYATGSASFRGDKRGTKMDIEATSADNSHFFMPLSGKEDVSYADFVRFRTSTVEGPDTSTFLKRRMLANERKRRPANTIGGVMDLDMTLNVLPNVDMQLVIDPTLGDIIQGRGSGQLTMHFVPKANILEMRGEYVISEGTYLFTLQNIWHKLFKVIPGSSVSWNGDPMAAQLNIDAVYEAKASLRPLVGSSLQGIDVSRAVAVNCYIKLTDDMMSPTVTFDIEVPNVAPEIQTVIDKALNDQQAIATQMFWLLAANTFSSEDTGAVGASLSATTGFEMLSNQLSNWLSGDNYNVVLRYRPRTEQTGDEVDFGFSKSWLDNRLLVEIEGGYLSDAALQATEKASNFVGEAFITWLIDPDGAFRLKGFTQTIDRYGENQGMQESGVGVYYSESFNTFGELGESLKNRFKRDTVARAERRFKRDSQRTARQAQREVKRSQRELK